MSDLTYRVRRHLDLCSETGDTVRFLSELLEEAEQTSDELIAAESDSRYWEEFNTEEDWVESAYSELENQSEVMSKKKIKTVTKFLERAS